MAEIQEQRYVCKICNKSCVSGKSLGGHMRVHLARISASKKAAKEKAEIKIHDDQSDIALLSEEKTNDRESKADFGDGDQNNSYELRENPKKSWRISDPKHGVVSKNSNSCRECSKEFPSLRALAGHMRCHSIKNIKKVHQCKKCGKAFDSIKAMFGHMKSHSKKPRVANDSADSLSDLENLCPVRRKRSRIRYKSTSNPTFSDIDVSNSVVSELGEAEEAATCLIMLSRGMRDCLKFVTESSDDDSVYFKAESSCRSKKFSGYDGDYCLSGYAYPFIGKNVSECNDLDSKFTCEDQRNVDSEVAPDELLTVEKEMKVDFEKLLKPEESYEFDDSKSTDSTKSAEFDKDFLVATGKNEISCVHESDFEKNSSENEANLQIMEHFEKRPEYKRRTCKKISCSHSPLGGQNARQKMHGNSSAVCMKTCLLSAAEDDSKLDQLECRDNQLEQESTSKSKEYECVICFKVFSSGQALGGHKRAHYNGFTESKNQEAMAMNQEVAQVEDLLDLNFPVTVGEGIKRDVGFDPWWIDRSREHETLVLTN